jgi:hypothetical protein
MTRRSGVAAAFFLLAIAGCGSSSASEDSVKQDFAHGISQLRAIHDYEKLRAKLTVTLRKLRQEPAPSTAARRAKGLAVQGFSSTLRGVDSEIDLVENDRGEIGMATRDAKRAARSLRRGARLLRAAGRILGVRVGSFSGL